MGERGKGLWLKGAGLSLAAGLALGYLHRRAHPGGGGLDSSVYVILAFAAGWLGAAAGGAVEWLRYGRSPLTPFFKVRFGWHYTRRYWRRFAFVFVLGWLAFVVLCIAVALAAGALDEARTFFTPEGAAAVLLFVVVFWLEGAMVGGIIDLLRFLSGKKASGRPASNTMR